MRFDLHVGPGDRVIHLRLEPAPSPGDGAGDLEFSLGEAEEWHSASWAEIMPGTYSIIIGGRSYEAMVTADRATSAGDAYTVAVGTRIYRITLRDPRSRSRAPAAASHEGPLEMAAPMPGKIVKVLVERGQAVEAGRGLLVIEAMKMQNEFKAPRAGRVEEIYVQEGAGVEAGAKLVRLS